MDDTRSRLALLFRRAGFGARPDELDAAEKAGTAATLDSLLATPTTTPTPTPAEDAGAIASPPPQLRSPGGYLQAARADPAVRRQLGTERKELIGWWVDRMTAVDNPWPEKLVWFWHGHFATAISKVQVPAWMLTQQNTLRAHGSGTFVDLLTSMVADPAMLVWLDGRTSRRAHPNENFARECMELFSLGHGDYTEDDVRELARAFTGWQIDPATGTSRYVAAHHDDGAITALGYTGPLDSGSAVRLIASRADCASFLAARAWSRFAAPANPGDAVTAPLVAALGPRRDLGAMWRALFTADAFTTDAVRTGLVKQPVEWMVGVLRMLRLRGRDMPSVLPTLAALGQTPFDPPNVGGWPANQAWLTTSAVLARSRFALAAARRGDVSLVADAAPGDRLDAVARLLSIDRWSVPSAAALSAATDDPHRLTALAAISPENLLA